MVSDRSQPPQNLVNRSRHCLVVPSFFAAPVVLSIPSGRKPRCCRACFHLSLLTVWDYSWCGPPSPKAGAPVEAGH